MSKPLARAFAALAAAASLTACGAVQQPPPPTPTPTTSPSATASTSTQSTEGWTRMTWPAAGISVMLPGKPHRGVVARTLQGVTIAVRLAVVPSNIATIEVGSSTFSVNVPAKNVDTVLQDSIKTYAGLIGGKVSSSHPSRFRGLPARTAVVTINGARYELLVFQRDARRSVFIFAPTGTISHEVARSLRLL